MDLLAAAAGVSPRHLERLFAREVGLPPKTLLRILRFRATLARLEAAPPGSAAAVALEGGYADQAHLCRDARDLAGGAPGRILGSAEGLGTPFRREVEEVGFLQDGGAGTGEHGPRSEGGTP